MHSYQAPIRDVRFCMQEVLGFAAHYASLPAGDNVSMAEVNAILEAIAEFAEQVLAPLNRSGDEEGAHFENGRVRSPSGFAEAYRQYVDGGWPRLANPE